jgi:hypothetical protein
MGRKNKFRPGLNEAGVFKDSHGTELGRLSYDKMLVINEEALYRWLLRAAVSWANKVPLTKINQTFGATGGWGRDPYVDAVLEYMESVQVVYLYRNEERRVYAVKPTMVAHQALKLLNKYTKQEEYHAGLEPLDEDLP